jgi:hypothetical protein
MRLQAWELPNKACNKVVRAFFFIMSIPLITRAASPWY